jgi:hypothetical protein
MSRTRGMVSCGRTCWRMSLQARNALLAALDPSSQWLFRSRGPRTRGEAIPCKCLLARLSGPQGEEVEPLPWPHAS